MIESIGLKNFMAFEDIQLDFSPKINVIIGENGTGKTQLLKAIYSSRYTPFHSDASINDEAIENRTHNLINLFLPLDRKLGKLYHKGASARAVVSYKYKSLNLVSYEFNYNSQDVSYKREKDALKEFNTNTMIPTFMPTKEVLSFMEGFRSIYEKYVLSFDKTYYDICSLLELPPLREENISEKSKWAQETLEEIYNGHFIFHGGGKVTFKTKDDFELSANSVAEGFRKLGVLARLLETGAIDPGKSGPLLWDEPEANLNPKIMETLAEILLELSRQGQQIIIATHDYVLLKWLDLLASKDKGDHVMYHTLYRDETKNIHVSSTDSFDEIDPNPIDDTYGHLINKEIKNEMGDIGKW